MLLVKNHLSVSLYCLVSIVFQTITVECIADTGDVLIITGEIVNVRSAPSTESEIIIKLSKDRKVIEIQRKNDWIEIHTNRKDISSGWIHKSLISSVRNTATLNDNRFKKFMQGFKEYNEITKTRNGDIYFTEAKNKESGQLDLIATESWLNAEREVREESFNAVFQLWSSVIPVGKTASARVLDEQGEQHMLMLR
jgi:SH3-like domain-containing protein